MRLPLFGLAGVSLLAFALTIGACKETPKATNNPNYQQEAANADYLHDAVYGLTEVLVHDIFPPPIAARNYAYSTIASYEAMIPGDPTRQSLAGRLKGLASVPKPEAGKEYCFPLAGVRALMQAGKNYTFSGEKMEALRDSMMEQYRKIGIPEDVFERSIAYGDTVAGAIVAWSKGDNYAQTRSAAKYSVDLDNPARWRPTPPDYSDALEPHWPEIRTMCMDSAQQFKPTPAPKFSKDKNSQIYKLAYEVMKVVKDSLDATLSSAKHWDDNAFATDHQGHVTMATKKITPGGHWLNIAKIVARAQKRNIYECVEMYTLTSIGLHDGFISCWDEKYRSNLLRPETYINEYIDPEWRPTLQTPAFPEHTSGHSVISGCASEILTTLLGDNVAFDDSTEVIFDLPVQSFPSFRYAAKQASYSRLYGGIHYRTGVEAGLEQGSRLGRYVIERLKTKK